MGQSYLKGNCICIQYVHAFSCHYSLNNTLKPSYLIALHIIRVFLFFHDFHSTLYRCECSCFCLFLCLFFIPGAGWGDRSWVGELPHHLRTTVPLSEQIPSLGVLAVCMFAVPAFAPRRPLPCTSTFPTPYIQIRGTFWMSLAYSSSPPRSQLESNQKPSHSVYQV
jgi:hypothetical protein